MPWLSQQRQAANLNGIALGFLTLIALISLPEVTVQHSLAVRKIMVKNVVCDNSIFSPVLGAVSRKRDVALG